MIASLVVEGMPLASAKEESGGPVLVACGVINELNKLKPEARQDKVTIVEKNEKIAKLEAEKVELENQIVKLKSQIDELNQEVTSLKDEVAAAKDETEAVKEELEAKKKMIEIGRASCRERV